MLSIEKIARLTRSILFTIVPHTHAKLARNDYRFGKHYPLYTFSSQYTHKLRIRNLQSPRGGSVKLATSLWTTAPQARDFRALFGVKLLLSNYCQEDVK